MKKTGINEETPAVFPVNNRIYPNEMKKQEIIELNRIRNRDIRREQNAYNPLIGYGGNVIERQLMEIPELSIPKFYAPNEMLRHPLVKSILEYGSIREYIIRELQIPPTKEITDIIADKTDHIRKCTDFEYAAVREFRIKPKPNAQETESGDVPFIANRAQLRLLRRLEKLRLQRKPVRIIILKARQWGGSTLIQLYMAWIQLYHKTQWNSTICAHVESTTRIIKGMYSKLLSHMSPGEIPGNLLPLRFAPYEGSHKTSIIRQRDCRVTIGSAEKPDGVRGEDTVMAHLSEVGIWKKTEGKSPEDIVNSICSGIPVIPLSLIVYESTAKGVGNFFHREWKRAENRKSAFTPVFIPWFETDSYSLPIEKYGDFISAMSDFEWSLWEKGATLEQINWYRHKSREYSEEWSMRQEYPSDPVEAFQSSGRRRFNIYCVDRMRRYCRTPKYYGNITADATDGRDALKNLKFTPLEKPADTDGLLSVWQLPDKELIKRRYVVSVDIGGKSKGADFSVIKVFDRRYMMEPGGVPEVAAQWRGHISHYLLAWKAAQIASFYNNALLVIESNTVETEGTEGSHFEYILDEIADTYGNLYFRNSSERIREGVPPKWGFHTNKSTKVLIVDHLEKMLEQEGYIERSDEACDEMDTYEIRESGELGAVEGNHDDILMATAIGVYACYDLKYIPLPEYFQEHPKEQANRRQIYSEASF